MTTVRPPREAADSGVEVRPGLAVAGLLLLAGAAGAAAAFAPVPTLLVVAGALGVTALLVRVEWTALLVVAAAPFEDYLRELHPDVIKVLAVLLVLGWLGRRLTRSDRGSLQHPVAGAALALLVVLLAATALNPNVPAGPGTLGRYLGFLAVTVVLLDLFRRGLPVARVAAAYVVACTAAAGCGLVTWFVADDARVGGPLEDPNDLAFFLLVALPFSLALRRSARRPIWYDLATLLLLVGLVGTLSRGALLGLVLSVVFALAFRQVRPAAVVALVVITFVGLGAAVLTVPEQVDDSLSDKASIADQNVDDRLGLWRVAGEMTLRHPVLGLGPGGFSTHVEEYADDRSITVSHDLDVAHNLYLETSSELGIAGLAALLALLGTGGACAMRRWQADGDPVAAATATALVGSAAAAMFLSEQYFLPMWMLAAFGAGAWPRREPDRGVAQG